MSTSLTVPAAGPEAAPPYFNFPDLLLTGPESVAFLSVLLLTGSAHNDFPLGNKATLLTRLDSFKTSAQQVVNETYNAYPENDKAFNALQLLLSQVPPLIDQFLIILNEGGPDGLKFLGQNALNSVSKLVTMAVNISEQAEKNFDNLLALVQELLVAILSTSGGRALQQAEHRELDVSIARTGVEAIQNNINTSSKALSDFQTRYKEAVKRFQEASSHLSNGAETQAVGAALVESLASSLALAAEQFISRNTRALDDAKVSVAVAEARLVEHKSTSHGDAARNARVAFEEAQKRFEEASKSILPEWALAGDVVIQPLAVSGAAAAQNNSASVQALRTARASLVTAQNHFEDAVKNLPTGWDRLGADVAQSAEGGISSGGSINAQSAEGGIVSSGRATSATADSISAAAVKERAASALRKAQESLTDTQRQFDEAVKDLPTGWDLVGRSVASSLATSVTGIPSQPTVASAEALRAAKAAFENAQATFQDALRQLPPGWEDIGSSVLKSLHPEQVHKTEPSSQSLRGPVPKIVQLLRKIIDNYHRHAAQVKQITQLLKSVQTITDTTAPKAIDGLYASLSSGDKTALQASQSGTVTLGNLQKDIVLRQAKKILDITNAVNRISAIYIQVSIDYTLPSQRKLGERIQFPTKAISAHDDKHFLAQLEAQEAEVLRTNAETKKKILQLIGI